MTYPKNLVTLVNKAFTNYDFELSLLGVKKLLDYILEENWPVWETNTILKTLNDKGFSTRPLDHRNLTKVRVLQALSMSPHTVLSDYNLFEKCIIGGSGGFVDFFTTQEPDFHYTSLFLKLLPKLTSAPELSDEIKIYIGITAIDQNIFWYPDDFIDDCIVAALSAVGESIDLSKELVELRPKLKAFFEASQQIDLNTLKLDENNPVHMSFSVLLESILMTHINSLAITRELKLIQAVLAGQEVELSHIRSENLQLNEAVSLAEDNTKTIEEILGVTKEAAVDENAAVDESITTDEKTKIATLINNHSSQSGPVLDATKFEGEGDGPDADRECDPTLAEDRADSPAKILEKTRTPSGTPDKLKVPQAEKDNQTPLLNLFL